MNGRIIFIVTTANGSVPICGAKVNVKLDGKETSVLTDGDGKSYPIEFCFSDGQAYVEGFAEISSENFHNMLLQDIKLYPDTTVMRIVNLDRIR